MGEVEMTFISGARDEELQRLDMLVTMFERMPEDERPRASEFIHRRYGKDN